ncbi:hypothetical protein [Lyticum sinuosum]|uniref:Uncharacterized protein n=1 Tax=Lyticum sinuosum TaxID=1332059 RepID=A0AAE4VJB2_9RICK|nr:hypothetical protein [Lyticum sinuosum]MDZ5760857.1 hypothetical protein [Lyticum sinuosum]
MNNNEQQERDDIITFDSEEKIKQSKLNGEFSDEESDEESDKESIVDFQEIAQREEEQSSALVTACSVFAQNIQRLDIKDNHLFAEEINKYTEDFCDNLTQLNYTKGKLSNDEIFAMKAVQWALFEKYNIFNAYHNLVFLEDHPIQNAFKRIISSEGYRELASKEKTSDVNKDDDNTKDLLNILNEIGLPYKSKKIYILKQKLNHNDALNIFPVFNPKKIENFDTLFDNKAKQFSKIQNKLKIIGQAFSTPKKDNPLEGNKLLLPIPTADGKLKLEHFNNYFKEDNVTQIHNFIKILNTYATKDGKPEYDFSKDRILLDDGIELKNAIKIAIQNNLIPMINGITNFADKKIVEANGYGVTNIIANAAIFLSGFISNKHPELLHFGIKNANTYNSVELLNKVLKNTNNQNKDKNEDIKYNIKSKEENKESILKENDNMNEKEKERKNKFTQTLKTIIVSSNPSIFRQIANVALTDNKKDLAEYIYNIAGDFDYRDPVYKEEQKYEYRDTFYQKSDGTNTNDVEKLEYIKNVIEINNPDLENHSNSSAISINTIESTQGKLKLVNQSIGSSEESIKDLTKIVNTHKSKLENLEKIKKEFKKTIKLVEDGIIRKERDIKDFENQIKILTDGKNSLPSHRIGELENEIKVIKKKIETTQTLLTKAKENLTKLQNKVVTNESAIKLQNKSIEETEAEIVIKQNELKNLVENKNKILAKYGLARINNKLLNFNKKPQSIKENYGYKEVNKIFEEKLKNKNYTHNDIIQINNEALQTLDEKKQTINEKLSKNEDYINSFIEYIDNYGKYLIDSLDNINSKMIAGAFKYKDLERISLIKKIDKAVNHQSNFQKEINEINNPGNQIG